MFAWPFLEIRGHLLLRFFAVNKPYFVYQIRALGRLLSGVEASCRNMHGWSRIVACENQERIVMS